MNKNDSTINIAEEVLKSVDGSLDIYALFAKVAEVKEYSEEEKDAMIAQFHTHLTTSGKFVILHDGTWSLRIKHPFEVVNTISTDFELFDEDEIVSEDEEEEYEALDVLVVTDEEEMEKETKNIKELIGYEESEEI